MVRSAKRGSNHKGYDRACILRDAAFGGSSPEVSWASASTRSILTNQQRQHVKARHVGERRRGIEADLGDSRAGFKDGSIRHGIRACRLKPRTDCAEIEGPRNIRMLLVRVLCDQKFRFGPAGDTGSCPMPGAWKRPPLWKSYEPRASVPGAPASAE